MEALIVGKPHSVVIGAMRALAEPMITHWGMMDAFIEEGLTVLEREGGGIFFDEENSPDHLEKLHRQVVHYRGAYFRAVGNISLLDSIYRELDQAASRANSPFRQGVLWIANHLQEAAIDYLQRPLAEEHRAKVLEAIQEKRNALAKPLADTESLTLERIEAVLAAFALSVLTETAGRFEMFCLAGHLLETVRNAARRPPDPLGGEDEPLENQEAAALVGLLSDPVRAGELNEARIRYSRLSDEEKKRRFNEFRRRMIQIVKLVAPYAPMGFEEFCQAIEANLYPYPEPMEFIRSFARSLHDNGSRSSIFENIQTPQAVEQRYEAMAANRQGNPLVLEIALAFAFNAFQESDLEEKKAAMREIDLKKEFGWPATMEELVEQLG